jgi:hypothetical protein
MKDTFRVNPFVSAIGSKPVQARMKDLKDLCFVRIIFCDPEHQKPNHFPPFAPSNGKREQVTFKDAEVLADPRQGYQSARPGFFLVPVDQPPKNERCFVVASANQSVANL